MTEAFIRVHKVQLSSQSSNSAAESFSCTEQGPNTSAVQMPEMSESIGPSGETLNLFT